MQVDFYCKRCKCSMKISYETTGNMDTPVLVGISMKCHTCKRVMTMKKCTERAVISHTDQSGKLYL